MHQHGGGSKEIELVQKIPAPQYEATKRSAIRYLKASFAAPGTIKMLEELPFELWEATNGFGDEFQVLHLKAEMKTYIEIENEVGVWGERISEGCPDICKAFETVAHPIRFIAAGLNLEQTVADVKAPELTITSDIVEEALRNAETLIDTHGASSGLDRVHTAMHAYLRAACENAEIEAEPDAGITNLFARLKEHHPALAISDPEGKQRIDQVLRGMARIMDALDPLRNSRSLAHPNVLLDDEEAMLAINLVRTMLRYLDSRLR